MGVWCCAVGCDKPDKERFKSGDQEPWIYRGGLLAEFRVGKFDRCTVYFRQILWKIFLELSSDLCL